MKSKLCLNTINLIMMAFCCNLSFAAQPKITVSIDSTVVEMGSLANISIDVSDPQGNGHIIGLPQPGTETDDLDYISVEADTTPHSKQYKIKIQTFTPGEFTFDMFRYVSPNADNPDATPDTIESNFLSLKVLPVPTDSLETINPLAPTVDVPNRDWTDDVSDFVSKYVPEYLIWILLAIILLDIAWLIYQIWQGKKVFGTQPKYIDPYEEAVTALQKLKEQRLPEKGRDKAYFTILVDILRVYLRRRFKINALEMSSTQILDSLRQNPETRNNQEYIRQILEVADFVKFANMRPLPDDIVKSFTAATTFVENTKPAPEPSDNEPTNATDKEK